MKSESKQVEDFYETTYKLYTKEDFSSVMRKIKESRTRFPENEMKAKFDDKIEQEPQRNIEDIVNNEIIPE